MFFNVLSKRYINSNMSSFFFHQLCSRLCPTIFKRENILMNLFDVCVPYRSHIWERLKLVLISVFVPRFSKFHLHLIRI